MPPSQLDPQIKDLTPPGFADLIPPPDPRYAGREEIPGALAPTVPGRAGFYGVAEFLLFRPRSDNLDFILPNAGSGLATTGPIDSVKYDLAPGLRAEFGYRFTPAWEAGFAYSYLRAGGDKLVQAAPGDVLFPTLTRPGLTDVVTSAMASATLNFNIYDMLVGRRFVIDNHLAVRAFCGFRFAGIQQSFNVQYDGIDAGQAAVVTSSRFNGFGPLIGGEAVAVEWNGFHLYARASGGLLTGRSSSSLVETNVAGGTVYVNTPFDVQKVVPVAVIGVGGGWQYRTVSVRFGYEVTHWFGLTERVRLVDDVAQGAFVSRPGNLSLDGFFVQLGLTF